MKPLWDDAFMWHGNFLSFTNLRRLLMRTSRSIIPEVTHSRESEVGYSECPKKAVRSKLELELAHLRRQEDNVVRDWLVSPPDHLNDIVVWTKAFAGRTNGERMVFRTRMPNESQGYNDWEVVRDDPIKGKEVCSGSFM